MKPLIYLEIRQLINSIKNSVKSPKRLIPVLIMTVYIFASFINGLLIMSRDGSPHSPDLQMLSKAPIELIESVIFLFLSIICVSVMYSAFNSGLMIFSIAHIDFLFPTPVKRQHVLLIKLIKDYLKYTFWITFFIIFFGSAMFNAIGYPFLPWGIISIAALIALLIFVINIAHTINIVFTFGYERFRQLGIAIKTILIAAPVVAVFYALHKYSVTSNWYASVLWAAKSPVIAVVFTPVRWCSKLLLAPFYEVTYPDGWAQFAMLWLLAIGSAILLLSRKENVYEPSIGISVKISKRRQAIRAGDYASVKIDTLREKGTMRLSGISIPPFGTGAAAFIWKSLLMRYRMSHWKAISMVLVSVIAVYILKIYTNNEKHDFLRYLPLVLIYIVWILSMTAQIEMRTEFKHSNIVKAMPIAAWKIMLAQTIGTVSHLTLGILLFSFLMWLLLPQSRGWILTSSTVIAPFLSFAIVPAIIIPSIIYPDTKDIVQNYVSGLFSFILVSVVVAPTVILGVLLFVVFPNSKLICVTALCLSNIIMGAAGVTLAGATFKKYDPTSE